MAVTTKKLFPATSNATTTVFNNVGIQLNNQDDLDVYVTLSGGTRVLQLRQSTGSTAQSSHPQVNNTDGLYFPAVTAGTTLYNYTLSTDNNTITFNSALPQGAVVFCERRTRDADSSYTTFASGSTIRATDLNNSSTESNFTAQDGRNKALTIEGALFRGDQPSTNFVTTDHIVNGTIVDADIASNAEIEVYKLKDGAANQVLITQSDGTTTNWSSNLDLPGTLDVTGNVDLDSNLNVDGTTTLDATTVDGVLDVNGSATIDNVQVNGNEIDTTSGNLTIDSAGGDVLIDDNARVTGTFTVDGLTTYPANVVVTGSQLKIQADNSEFAVNNGSGVTKFKVDSDNGDTLIQGTASIANIDGAAVVTSGTSTSDTKFYSAKRAGELFYGKGTVEEIQSGETWAAADDKVATTAAIDARIIDLVDDVGGFVPIANETSFPTANPDVNNGAGTLVSIKTIGSTRTPSTGTVTIANGSGSNTVTITGCGSTVLTAGFGVIVETTSTLHTYTFHRLTPKATEVTTVASKATEVTTVHTNITNVNTVATNISDINAVAADATDIGAVAAKATEIGRLGTADAVADMAILGTADVVADMAILGTNDVVADLNTLGTADVVADMNTLATADIVSDMNALATSGNITAMSTCSTNIASINNASANISSANNFGDQYQVAANNPSTDGGGNALAAGDLYFNTSANELKVYNGSSWQGGVTAAGSFAATTGNTFTGDNRYNDGVKALFGTGSDLQIYHSGTYSHINDTAGSGLVVNTDNIFFNTRTSEQLAEFTANGAVELYYDNSKKFETLSTGVKVTGQFNVGNNLTVEDAANVAWTHNSNASFYHRAVNHELRDTSNNRFLVAGSGASNGVALYYFNGSSSTEKFKVATNVQIPADNVKLQLGASQDLEIYHNTSNYIDSKTGHLYLRAAGGNMYLNPVNNETGIAAIANGAVELYHNNNKKLETTSSGISTTGNASVNGHVTLPDEGTGVGKVILGDGSDLQIYHDGTYNRIASDVRTDFIKKTGSEHLAKFIPDGAVELFYDNTKRLETTSWGAAVTGNIDATGSVDSNELTINGTTVLNASRSLYNLGKIELADNIEARFGSSNDLKIFHESSSNDNIIDCATTRPLRVRMGGSNVFEFLSGGGIKMNDGKKVILGDSSDLQIYHDGSNSYIAEGGTGDLIITSNIIRPRTDQFTVNNAANNANMISALNGGAVTLFYDGSTKFATQTNGANITGGLNINGGTINNTNDATLHVTADNNNDWGVIIDKYNGSANEYGLRVDVGSGATYAMQVTGNNSEVFKISGAGAVTASSFIGSAITCNGELDLTGHLDLNSDSSRIKLGAGDDFQLYHNGSNNYIETNNGDIFITTTANNGDIVCSVSNTNGGFVAKTSSNETMINAVANASVELYEDGSKKLETTSYGASIGGSAGAISATVGLEISNAATTEIRLKNTGGGSANTDGFGIQKWSNGVTYLFEYDNHDIVIGTNNSSRWNFKSTGHFEPMANNSYDIGSSSKRVRNIYTNDLHLSNEGHSNDVDGTWGDWTMQEGESDLFLKNNRSGKKYKFNLTEVA